jgi:S-adenosylmethionine hydrolase
MKEPIITLLTDFGIDDGYVASMKGVALSICPEARLIDISHSIPPQDVRAGAFLLSCVYRYFPEGTVHLAVVDPGVGTERKALAIETAGHFFVGPDNGLFSWVLKRGAIPRVYSLEDPKFWRAEISETFHARDIFAPVAAHLANRVPLSSFGPPSIPQKPEWSSITKSKTGLTGEVIYIDHFGNAITNLTREDLEWLAPSDQWLIVLESISISSVVNTYGDAQPLSTVALIGSSGYLEVATPLGKASEDLGIRVGMTVSVSRRH